LQQVFINLINNSLDAMPAGGRLRFTTARRNGHVEVSCADTGQGIRADLKSRIFDPLFTTKERGRGSGLGLSVVQEIVREHGGEIEVESDAGIGTEFKIRLPVADQTYAQ
jgi:signal transduction histidine kinase